MGGWVGVCIYVCVGAWVVFIVGRTGVVLVEARGRIHERFGGDTPYKPVHTLRPLTDHTGIYLDTPYIRPLNFPSIPYIPHRNPTPHAGISARRSSRGGRWRPGSTTTGWGGTSKWVGGYTYIYIYIYIGSWGLLAVLRSCTCHLSNKQTPPLTNQPPPHTITTTDQSP